MQKGWPSPARTEQKEICVFSELRRRAGAWRTGRIDFDYMLMTLLFAVWIFGIRCELRLHRNIIFAGYICTEKKGRDITERHVADMGEIDHLVGSRAKKVAMPVSGS